MGNHSGIDMQCNCSEPSYRVQRTIHYSAVRRKIGQRLTWLLKVPAVVHDCAAETQCDDACGPGHTPKFWKKSDFCLLHIPGQRIKTSVSYRLSTATSVS